MLAFIDRDRVVLRSRRGLDYSAIFPELAAELGRQLVSTMVLDGEIVAFGPDGKPSFDALQNRAQLKTAREIAAAERGDADRLLLLRSPPLRRREPARGHLRTRRRYLTQCLLPSARVQLVHADDDAQALYDAALASGFEGIMAKRRDSPYLAGRRSGHWLKVKSTTTQEFVVGGYTKGKGAREALGALLLGVWEQAGPSLRRPRRQRLRRRGAQGDQAARRARSRRRSALHRDSRRSTARRPGSDPSWWRR